MLTLEVVQRVGAGQFYFYANIGDPPGEGTVYEWRLGLTMYEAEAFGNVITNGGSATLLLATPDVETGKTTPDNYVAIVIYGSSTGEYKTVPDDTLSGRYVINGERWDFSAITLRITKFEEVGGVIEGTFSGTILTPLSEPVALVDGQFRVKRIADNSFLG
jgi:hypothetical protein